MRKITIKEGILIKWSNIKSFQELVNSLQGFLEDTFGVDFLEKWAKKYELWKSKGKPEKYRYLRTVNVHRAVKWWSLLESVKARGYSFDLRFSSEIEELMNILIFAYTFNTLLQRDILSLSEPAVRGKLKSKDHFDSLVYEVLVAANYASNGFKTSMVEFLDKGRVDIYVEDGNIRAYVECKKLKRNEKYTDIAIELLQWLHSKKINVLLDITFNKTPKSKKDVKQIVKSVKNYLENRIVDKNIKIRKVNLPEICNAPLNVGIDSRFVEYVTYALYMGVFGGVLKIKEPKVLILRNPNKINEILRQVENELRKAYDQLRSVDDERAYKLVYVDISDVLGRPAIPVFESSSEIREDLSLAEIEFFCRKWLKEHSKVNAIVLTSRKLYLDPFANPYALIIENRVVTAFTAPGWSIETLVIPMPRNAPAEVLTNTGAKLAEKGLCDIAMYYYRKALELKPDLKEAWNNIGNLFNKLGKFEEAARYLDKALKLDPSYVLAWINKGISLICLGRCKEALGCFDKAIQLDPNNEKAWYNKAVLLLELGKNKEARLCTLKALSINPHYELAKRLKEYLDSLQS